MKVGYVVLYEDGELVISKNHTLLQKKIIKDYGEFEDTDVPWINKSSQIKNVQILDQVKSNYMKEWFMNCKNLTTLINFKKLDVSDCINFFKMFAYCKSLQNIKELQNWNVSNGKDFSFMFYGCKSLQDLNRLQNWNVSSGTNFSRMFEFCMLLQNINELQNWNVANGMIFSRIFFGCKGLIVSTALEDWNMEHAENINGMFSSCFNLKEIHLSDTLQFLNRKIFINCNANLKIHWKGKIYTCEDLMEYQEF